MLDERPRAMTRISRLPRLRLRTRIIQARQPPDVMLRFSLSSTQQPRLNCTTLYILYYINNYVLHCRKQASLQTSERTYTPAMQVLCLFSLVY